MDLLGDYSLVGPGGVSFCINRAGRSKMPSCVSQLVTLAGDPLNSPSPTMSPFLLHQAGLASSEDILRAGVQESKGVNYKAS